MHSFFIDCQSLRELRIASVLMIAAIQQRNVGRIQCCGTGTGTVGTVTF
jgi:hypothetical protein